MPLYYPLADLMRWLAGDPFIQIGRHTVVNLQAIEHVTHYGDRLYRGGWPPSWNRNHTTLRGARRVSCVLEDATLNCPTLSRGFTKEDACDLII